MSSLINFTAVSDSVLFTQDDAFKALTAHEYGTLRVSAVWRSADFRQQNSLHEHEYGFGTSILLHVEGPLADEFNEAHMESTTSQTVFIVSGVVSLCESFGAGFLNSHAAPLRATREDLTADGRVMVDILSAQYGSEATFITELIQPFAW